jgi:hypothetical protein
MGVLPRDKISWTCLPSTFVANFALPAAVCFALGCCLGPCDVRVEIFETACFAISAMLADDAANLCLCCFHLMRP